MTAPGRSPFGFPIMVDVRDRPVFVAGGGNSAGQAVLYLARYARRVTLLIRGPSGRKRFNVLGAIDAVTRELDAGGTGRGVLRKV